MTSSINISQIKKSVKKLRNEFKNAYPYPHVVIEDFFKREYAEKFLKAFPTVEQMRASTAFSGVAEKKNQLSDISKFPKILKKGFEDLMTSEFLSLVSQITDIKPLYPDRGLVGGGLHQGVDGSFLDIHADFNKLNSIGKYRRLNILIYLNKNWKDSYRGHLEMWDKQMKNCAKKVAPVFNRCLIFATDKYSYHGYKAMTLPSNISRKSMAAYYYSDTPAPGEDYEFHNTIFKARPSELRNKFLYPILGNKSIQKLYGKIGKIIFGTINKN